MRDAEVAANLHPLFVKTNMPANSKQGLGPVLTFEKRTKSILPLQDDLRQGT